MAIILKLALFATCAAVISAQAQSCNTEDNVDFNGNDLYEESTRAESAKECCDLCSVDERCEAFTWNKNTKECWMKDSDAGRASNSAGVSGYPLKKNTMPSCNTEDNVDFNGNDLYGESTPAESAKECCDLCSGDERCEAFTWNKNTKECWMKDSDAGRASNSAGVSGYPVKKGCTIELCRCQLEDGIDFNGNDLSSTALTTQNAEECCEECNLDKSCKAFTWNKRNKNCWLKESDAGRSSVDVGVSGLRASDNCSPEWCPCDPLENTDFSGNDLYENPTDVKDFNECCSLCNLDASCKAFTYNTQSNVCWLKDSDAGKAQNSDGMSGYPASM